MGGQFQVGEMRPAVAQDRYVVLVVGPETGESWPGVETVVCDDADEAVVWLEGSRPWSAVVVVDRSSHAEVAARAERLGVPVVVGGSLPAGDLAAWLRERARPIRSAHDAGRCGAALAGEPPAGGRPGRNGGRMVAVCGPGGTGASTVAMAVAAGLADLGATGIVLADLALRAGQAVLHGVAPTEVGLEELVHAHRNRRLARREVRAWTLALDGRDYRLLVGLHRQSRWTAIRPIAFDAALEALRATFSVVVADVTGDLEGEAATGSADVEERNHMARRCIATSDVVVVVGAPGPTGRMALERTLEAVGDHRGDARGTIKVLNRLRASPVGGGDELDSESIGVGPIPLDGDLTEWGRPITEAVTAGLGDLPPPHPLAGATLVSPGSIGHWQGAR